MSCLNRCRDDVGMLVVLTLGHNHAATVPCKAIYMGSVGVELFCPPPWRVLPPQCMLQIGRTVEYILPALVLFKTAVSPCTSLQNTPSKDRSLWTCHLLEHE